MSFESLYAKKIWKIHDNVGYRTSNFNEVASDLLNDFHDRA